MTSQQSVFISYSRRDLPFARDVQRFLERVPGFRVTNDIENTQEGANRWDDTQRIILECRYFLVVLSKYSAMSGNVDREVKFAVSRGKQIIPILLQEADGFPPVLENIQRIDARRHFDRAMRQLLDVLSTVPSSITAANWRRGTGNALRPPASKSLKGGWLGTPMPSAMVPVLLALAIGAWFHVMTAWFSSGPLVVDALCLSQAVLLMWVGHKLSRREFAIREAGVLVSLSIAGSVLLLTLRHAWAGDGPVLPVFLIAGLFSEMLALVILLTKRSIRRYMPS